MCVSRKHFGSTFKGAFAEEIAIPVGARMHAYADEINDLIGGLSETMANAIYCSRKVDLEGEQQCAQPRSVGISWMLLKYIVHKGGQTVSQNDLLDQPH